MGEKEEFRENKKGHVVPTAEKGNLKVQNIKEKGQAALKIADHGGAEYSKGGVLKKPMAEWVGYSITKTFPEKKSRGGYELRHQPHGEYIRKRSKTPFRKRAVMMVQRLRTFKKKGLEGVS